MMFLFFDLASIHHIREEIVIILAGMTATRIEPL